MQDQLEYYQARARQETKAADSDVPEAAFAHRRLAQEYEMLTRELRASGPISRKEIP